MKKIFNLFLRDLAITKYITLIIIACGIFLCSILILTPLEFLQNFISNNTWMASTNIFENTFDITFSGIFLTLPCFILTVYQQRITVRKTSPDTVLSRYVYWLFFSLYQFISLFIFLKIYNYLTMKDLFPIFILFSTMMIIVISIVVPLSFLHNFWPMCLFSIIAFCCFSIFAKTAYKIMNHETMQVFNKLPILSISILLIIAILSSSIFLSTKCFKHHK